MCICVCGIDIFNNSMIYVFIKIKCQLNCSEMRYNNKVIETL